MSEVEQLTFEFAQRPTIKGFPELRWTGKRPYKSTQYYPAQLRETYGEEQNGWMNKIFWGDNLQVMSHLLKEYRGQIQLIYIPNTRRIRIFEISIIWMFLEVRATKNSLSFWSKKVKKAGTVAPCLVLHSIAARNRKFLCSKRLCGVSELSRTSG